MRFTTKLLATATALVACSCLPATLLAGPIQIQFTGLELEYDGFSVGDLNPFGSAALDTATIQHNGVNVTGSPMVSGVSIDLDIPNVPNIPLGGGSVTSAAGGTLDLLFPWRRLLVRTPRRSHDQLRCSHEPSTVCLWCVCWWSFGTIVA